MKGSAESVGAELLPCPFCGVAPALNEWDDFGNWGSNDNRAQICCENEDCPIESVHTGCDRGVGRAEAIAAWNTRAGRVEIAGQTPPPEVVAKLRAALRADIERDRATARPSAAGWVADVDPLTGRSSRPSAAGRAEPQLSREELIANIAAWAQSDAGKRAIDEALRLAGVACDELAAARKIDPAMLNVPYGRAEPAMEPVACDNYSPAHGTDACARCAAPYLAHRINPLAAKSLDFSAGRADGGERDGLVAYLHECAGKLYANQETAHAFADAAKAIEARDRTIKELARSGMNANIKSTEFANACLKRAERAEADAARLRQELEKRG